MNREPALGNTSWSTFLKLKSFFYFPFFCNNFSHLKTNYDLSWNYFWSVCICVSSLQYIRSFSKFGYNKFLKRVNEWAFKYVVVTDYF